ncbi:MULTISPECIES: response regulator transcription factor [unclassified Nonomuraea]|uniref:response regulator transcription factor n=1 Tax=unclassified Nonomuraea TaxID=2593643 RepID=UPI0035C19FDE
MWTVARNSSAITGSAMRVRVRWMAWPTAIPTLTPTERTVAEYAVQGLSNPEIAARLFVSRGTVKTHLAHVYAKLHVANRTELAGQAADRLDTLERRELP